MNPWIQVLKLGSMPKIILPLLIGASLGFTYSGFFSYPIYILLILYGVAVQNAIVLLNDVADAKADAYHMEKYPSTIDFRVIPGGALSKKAVLVAGISALIAIVAISLVATIQFNLSMALPIALLSIFLLVAYSFHPLKINYRGGGEIFESIGTGLILPLTGFYWISGSFVFSEIFVPISLYALASSFSSGLKHLQADRETGKKTVAVFFGDLFVKRAILFLTGVSIALTFHLTVFKGTLSPLALPLTVFLPLYYFYCSLKISRVATLDNISELSRFKRYLHRIIFISFSGISIGIMGGVFC